MQQSGCAKEYSCEGCDTVHNPLDTTTIQDTTIVQDTTTTSLTDSFPQCDSCNETKPLAMNTWSFKIGNSFICGTFTNPGFFSGLSRTAITLFGPSACSVDTGIVLSVYLPVPLDRDRNNIIASSTAFYYYDHNSTNDIFDSADPYPFSIIIDSYNFTTNIVSGRFSGTVIKPNHNKTAISDGHFLATLH